MGKSLIEMAIAKKLMASFSSMNPFVALAAGLAMIVAGTMLSSSGGSGSGSGFSGGGLSSPSATSGAIQSQGDLTIIFPSGSVIDPSDPRQQDAIMRMIEAAQGRNVIIRTGAA